MPLPLSSLSKFLEPQKSVPFTADSLIFSPPCPYMARSFLEPPHIHRAGYLGPVASLLV